MCRLCDVVREVHSAEPFLLPGFDEGWVAGWNGALIWSGQGELIQEDPVQRDATVVQLSDRQGAGSKEST